MSRSLQGGRFSHQASGHSRTPKSSLAPAAPEGELRCGCISAAGPGRPLSSGPTSSGLPLFPGGVAEVSQQHLLVFTFSQLNKSQPQHLLLVFRSQLVLTFFRKKVGQQRNAEISPKGARQARGSSPPNVPSTSASQHLVDS